MWRRRAVSPGLRVLTASARPAGESCPMQTERGGCWSTRASRHPLLAVSPCLLTGTNLPASLQHPHVSTRKPLAANKAEATMASPEGFVHGPGHPRSRVASPSGSQGGSHRSRQLTLRADPLRGGRDARAREPPLSLSPQVSSSQGPRRLGLSSHLPRPRPRPPRAAGDAGSTGTRPFRPLVGSQPGKDQQWAYARDALVPWR